jgi:pimeloyl-ACP methyl ester carboxylesterase
VDQWVLIRGEDRTLPVLLLLHGAKDSAFVYSPYLGRRGGLERRFVVAYWDRRGTGRSAGNHVARESITIEQYAADTLELVDWLRARFTVEKVALFGASVGSLVGALAAARAPDRISALVSMGQFVNDVEATAIAHRIATERAREQADGKATCELEEIGPPPYDFARSWRFYAIAARIGPYADMPETTAWFAVVMMRTLLRTPGYSVRDKLRALGKAGPLEILVPQLARYDLRVDVPRIDVPVVVLQGRLDHQTPGVLVEDYLRVLDAPAGKRLIWLEESGHLVAPSDLGRFQAAMCEVAESLEHAAQGARSPEIPTNRHRQGVQAS